MSSTFFHLTNHPNGQLKLVEMMHRTSSLWQFAWITVYLNSHDLIVIKNLNFITCFCSEQATENSRKLKIIMDFNLNFFLTVEFWFNFFLKNLRTLHFKAIVDIVQLFVCFQSIISWFNNIFCDYLISHILKCLHFV